MRRWLAVVALAFAAPAASCAAASPQSHVEEPQVKLGEKPPDPAVEKERAIERARKHLADELKVGLDTIVVRSAKAVTWRDASLGCPEKDRMYAQVLSTGHEVILEVAGKTHELHLSPTRVVTCKKDKNEKDAAPR
jgi:hypothetical protein